MRGNSLKGRTLRKSQPGQWRALEQRLPSRIPRWAELAEVHCCGHAESLAGGARERHASVSRTSQTQRQQQLEAVSQLHSSKQILLKRHQKKHTSTTATLLYRRALRDEVWLRARQGKSGPGRRLTFLTPLTPTPWSNKTDHSLPSIPTASLPVSIL